MTIPKAAIERIIRNAGAERVSEEAVEELREAVIELGREISSDSEDYADYADRNTITREDIEMAVKH